MPVQKNMTSSSANPWRGKGSTYYGGFAEEECWGSLVRVRLMQWPELTKTRVSRVTAAELER